MVQWGFYANQCNFKQTGAISRKTYARPLKMAGFSCIPTRSLLMVIIVVLLVKHEEGYSGPNLQGRGRSKGSSSKDAEDHHEHDSKRTSMQQRVARCARELKDNDIVVRHTTGAHTPNWLSRTWWQWCLWCEHQGYIDPRTTGKGRNGGCGGSTDEDADEDDDKYDDMRHAIRVSMSDTPRRLPPANTATAEAEQPKKGAKCPVWSEVQTKQECTTRLP